MRRIVCFLFTTISLLAAGGRAGAQDQPLEPILVICATSYQNVLADIDYLSKAADDEHLIKKIDNVLGLILQIKDLHIGQLEGLDKERPLGAAILTDGILILPMLFLPVQGEVEAMLKSLAPFLGQAQKGENGIYAVGQGQLTGFLKVENGWAYLAQLQEHLEKLPNPLQIFGDLPAKYDTTMQFNVQKIPEVFRELATDQLRISLETAEAKKPDESDAMFALRQAMGTYRSKLIERGLTETEQVTFGLTVDAEAKRGRSDVIIKPLADSPAAAHFASLRDLKTKFGGVLEPIDEKPFLHMNLTGTLEAATIAQFTTQLEAYRAAVLDAVETSTEVSGDEERQVFKELTGGVLDVARATLEAGQLDVAIRITDKPTRNLVAAARVARGADLADLFQRVGALALEDKSFTAVKLNEAEHNGTPIHSFTLKASPELEPLAKMFNGSLKIYVAATADTAWIGIGPQAIEQMQQAMDGGEAAVQPMHAKMSLVPILRTLGQSTQEQQIQLVVSLMAMQLQKLDAFEMTASITDEGSLQLRADSEPGFLRLISVMVTQFAPLLLQQGANPGGGRLPF